MTSINGSQHMASLALRGLDRSSDVMRQAMEKLSTGKRINRSADDAAGMGITLVHKAQTMGLGGAIKHAGNAIGIVNTIEGALSSTNQHLLRLKELAIQSSSDMNTKSERKFIQDEVNQINMAINRIATDTAYNNKKLLDGTYNSKITIGNNGKEFVNLSVKPMDTSSIGSHELNTNVEITTLQNDHDTAKTTLTNAFSSSADYEVKGENGNNTITMNGGESAKEVAKSFNLVSGSTGINAASVTRAKIVSVSDIDHFTFTLQGKGETASIVSATITDTNNLTSLKDSINSVTSNTGIVASLTDDQKSINLVQSEGYNIIIGDLSASVNNMVVDAVEMNNAGVVSDKGDQRTLNGSGAGSDSVAIVGQVTLSSSKAFSVTPGHADNHFNASVNTIISNFSSLNNIDLSTQQGASNAMAKIDSAIAMISEMRSELGAKNVRFQSIVNNLTNLEINTERHVDILEDANFGAETTKLAKSQVLQEASNAMIAQANNISKFMMSFLNMFK